MILLFCTSNMEAVKTLYNRYNTAEFFEQTGQRPGEKLSSRRTTQSSGIEPPLSPVSRITFLPHPTALKQTLCFQVKTGIVGGQDIAYSKKRGSYSRFEFSGHAAVIFITHKFKFIIIGNLLV